MVSKLRFEGQEKLKKKEAEIGRRFSFLRLNRKSWRWTSWRREKGCMTVCTFTEHSLQDICRSGGEEEEIDWAQFSCLQRPLVLETLQRPGARLPAAAAEGHGSPVGLVTQRSEAHVDFHIPLGVSNYGWILCLCNFDRQDDIFLNL